jgi:hypothetical protein
VETLWLSHDLRQGWGDRHGLRVSCCVVHDVPTGADLVFAAERPGLPGDDEGPVPWDGLAGAGDLPALYWFLEACRSEGCTLVGHNLRSFDWEVLAGEFEARGLLADRRAWHPGAVRLVDTLAHLHGKLGWRPSLEVLARANLGEGKLLDGAMAPRLWREGRWRQVLDYCRSDVDLTRRVWQRGRAEGRVAVGQRPDGAFEYVPVEW